MTVKELVERLVGSSYDLEVVVLAADGSATTRGIAGVRETEEGQKLLIVPEVPEQNFA